MTRPTQAATAEVWTLRTWLRGDPIEGFNYCYPSRESAERNGRMFQTAAGAVQWELVSPSGAVVSSWKARPGGPVVPATPRRWLQRRLAAMELTVEVHENEDGTGDRLQAHVVDVVRIGDSLHFVAVLDD